jgi:hypothetical protein
MFAAFGGGSAARRVGGIWTCAVAQYGSLPFTWRPCPRVGLGAPVPEQRVLVGPRGDAPRLAASPAGLGRFVAFSGSAGPPRPARLLVSGGFSFAGRLGAPEPCGSGWPRGGAVRLGVLPGGFGLFVGFGGGWPRAARRLSLSALAFLGGFGAPESCLRLAVRWGRATRAAFARCSSLPCPNGEVSASEVMPRGLVCARVGVGWGVRLSGAARLPLGGLPGPVLGLR